MTTTICIKNIFLRENHSNMQIYNINSTVSLVIIFLLLCNYYILLLLVHYYVIYVLHSRNFMKIQSISKK